LPPRGRRPRSRRGCGGRPGDLLRRRRAQLARAAAESAGARASGQFFDRAEAETHRILPRCDEVSAAAVARARAIGQMRAAAELGVAASPVAMVAIIPLPGGDLASAAALTLGGMLSPRTREIGRARACHDRARARACRASTRSLRAA
jgi:hypothetical protein